ncbi:replication-relaxation family protein [Kitasatospora griseola]|uniref:replication-relaxation family protein n=1 Tax=Kitasatospora griseola TaxID=2064 RepID=UPI00382FDBA3
MTDDQPDGTSPTTTTKKPAKERTAFVRAKAYPNGSTGPLRHSILRALGVLKVATVKQVWLLAQPDHEQPNTVASGLRDLEKNKLTEKRGSTSGLPTDPDPADGDAPTPPNPKPKRKPVRPPGSGAKIWGLTDLGLDAAKSTLPSSRKAGGRARSVGRATGAPHAMAVNDTIVAFTSPATPGEPIGTIADWVTEAPFPLPGDRTQFADAVLTAPAHGIPLLLVEVDLHNETPQFIAEKFTRYAEYFALTYKDPAHEGPYNNAERRPVWRRRYPTAGPDSLPPIALVLAGAGPRGLNNLLNKVQDLTRQHWRPGKSDRWHTDPFDFTASIPILACHFDQLTEHGPHAGIWWRFGSHGWQSLTDALAHTEYTTRTKARLAAEEQAREDAEQARREATRCPGCNRHDKEIHHPARPSDGTTLCGDCKDKEREAAREKALQAVRAAHDRRWPCYTCKGPLGGQPGHPLELRTEAPPETIECPSCQSNRDMNGRPPLILPQPTARELRQAKKIRPDDPWWDIRLIHARKYPNRR